MTHRDRHPILILILGTALTILAGCENPVVTPPPTLTTDDIAEIVASTVGAESGGMLAHMPDLITAAHGGTILDRAGGKLPSPQTDRRVRRSDTTTHDGESYGYAFDVLYSYHYSNSTFPQQDQFDPRLDYLIFKGNVSNGTFVTPTLAGTDNGTLSWYLRGLTLADPVYALDGTCLRHRSVKLLRKGLELSLDVGVALSWVATDPSTGSLRSHDGIFATVTISNFTWGDGSPITGGKEDLPLGYTGTLQFFDNGTATLAFTDEYDKGHSYTIDTRVGRVK